MRGDVFINKQIELDIKNFKIVSDALAQVNIGKNRIRWYEIKNIYKKDIIRSLELTIEEIEEDYNSDDLTENLDWNSSLDIHCRGEINFFAEKQRAKDEGETLKLIKNLLNDNETVDLI